ncbi:MAG: SDR family oxidoreductase [Verrucomicrobia bacterium]|nr:SDR family oxidoreductase [Verrucomicrobiota bacterium]
MRRDQLVLPERRECLSPDAPPYDRKSLFAYAWGGRPPARRWARPEELSGTAIYLASAASNFMSGQIIYVDGGMLAVLQDRAGLMEERHRVSIAD